MWEGQNQRCWRKGKKKGREREICVGKSNNGESDWSEKRQVEMGKDSSEEERYLFWARSCRVARNNGPNGDRYLVVVSSCTQAHYLFNGMGMTHYLSVRYTTCNSIMERARFLVPIVTASKSM